MDLNQWHFAHPHWLWTLIAIPMIGILYPLYYRNHVSTRQLEAFIDKHLLPYLLIGSEYSKKRLARYLMLWSIVWACLSLALAGPRWDIRDIPTFTRDQNLVILLDISHSMNAKDITPSRLDRAKQRIEDLLKLAQGVKIGLIAFAADPHMITPLTDDQETIRHLLPSIDTDLAFVQGSVLAPALQMASALLDNADSHNRAIIVISDGDFDDSSALGIAKQMAEKGIAIHTIGVGSQQGTLLKDHQGRVIKKNGAPILSKLEKEKFRELSRLGKGHYFGTEHSEPIERIFSDLEKQSSLQEHSQKTHSYWHERFYLFILPILPIMLWWYRRGYLVALFILSFLPISSYGSLSSLFYNSEQQAEHAYRANDYTTASQSFQDPYRKGAAYYRLGDFQAAEENFRQSNRPEVAASAEYNLGNALAQQYKLQEAIEAYEELLAKWPDHEEAKHNLDLVKKCWKNSKSRTSRMRIKISSKINNKNRTKKTSKLSNKNNNRKKIKNPNRMKP